MRQDRIIKEKIFQKKKELGKKLLILGHYYQRDEIVEFADAVGDSYQLAKIGAENSFAENIIFCGVNFMSEVAKILALPKQKVFLPNTLADCPLAQMASLSDVELAWKSLEGLGLAGDLIPITYVNSTAQLKAFCGKRGGAVCTSSSAKKILEWGLAQCSKVLFFPDENLGINTAKSLGIAKSEIAFWDPRGADSADEGSLKRARLILWKGYCHVHKYFKPEHIDDVRKKFPDCRVVVHPECDEEVVQGSDAAGSTSFLKEYVEKAPKGFTIVIGTEVSFINRLARENPTKRVIPLASSLCPNMFRTGLNDLEQVIDNLPKLNEVLVEDVVVEDAKRALDRMLAI